MRKIIITINTKNYYNHNNNQILLIKWLISDRWNATRKNSSWLNIEGGWRLSSTRIRAIGEELKSSGWRNSKARLKARYTAFNVTGGTHVCTLFSLWFWALQPSPFLLVFPYNRRATLPSSSSSSSISLYLWDPFSYASTRENKRLPRRRVATLSLSPSLFLAAVVVIDTLFNSHSWRQLAKHFLISRRTSIEFLLAKKKRNKWSKAADEINSNSWNKWMINRFDGNLYILFRFEKIFELSKWDSND